MESSGKWPEEMNAIDKVKTAFYVHMAKALKEKKGMVASPTEDYLDIFKVTKIEYNTCSHIFTIQKIINAGCGLV